MWSCYDQHRWTWCFRSYTVYASISRNWSPPENSRHHHRLKSGTPRWARISSAVVIDEPRSLFNVLLGSRNLISVHERLNHSGNPQGLRSQSRKEGGRCLKWPKCVDRMKAISFIEQRSVIMWIFKHLDFWDESKLPPKPLELVCEPTDDYVLWKDNVLEIEAD